MHVPRHWAPATGSATGPEGRRYRLKIWGWSDESPADALRRARERVSEVAARLARGEATAAGYAYGSRPLREEILRPLGRGRDAPEALVTRNRYGAEVLNTARVPFVDVDVPPVGRLGRLFRRLRGRPATREAEVLARIRAACADRGEHSFRLYRTRAGFRLLVTDRLLDPEGAESRALLEAFGADPAFVRLCAVQACFRARLTPKPFRCGCSLPPGRHPREEGRLREAFDLWLRRYEEACHAYATCRYLETLGPGRQLREARAVVDEHDRTSRADSGLPLA